MSRKVRVDPDTIPNVLGFTDQDFVCSPSVRSAPLGGINSHSIDTSVVMNMPIGPDGERMVATWGYPERAPIYEQQGLKPVPQEWTHNEFNGGKPIIMTSASVTKPPGGGVFRDGGMLQLWATTSTNNARLTENNRAAAARQKGGLGAHAAGIGADDAYAARHGVKMFTEDVYEQGPGISQERKTMISLSGPKLGETETSN